MAKLVYWVARQYDDARCYNIIGKTRKEVLEVLKTAANGEYTYSPPVKVEMYYKDAFDLFDQATNEGGGR